MKTILYYTSNSEPIGFEAAVIEKLLENCGDLPIISISQQPLPLGYNICVGDVGKSTLNMFRQILIGARAAQTEYVVFAEADFLYPPEYFEFEPTGEDFYRYDNVWLVYPRRQSYYQIPWSNGAQIAKRQFVIDQLEKYLEGYPEWSMLKPTKKDYNGAVPTMIHGKIPCLSFKTGLA